MTSDMLKTPWKRPEELVKSMHTMVTPRIIQHFRKNTRSIKNGLISRSWSKKNQLIKSSKMNWLNKKKIERMI
jgi:hypothetical protein